MYLWFKSSGFMKRLLFVSLAFAGILVNTPLLAQVAFSVRNDRLYEKNAHSAVPVGIADMNGDGLDDIVMLNYGRRLTVQYQTPGFDRPFIRYETEITIGANEQNDVVIGDFNNDGWNDMVITGTYDQMKILYAEPYSYRFKLENIPASAFFSQGASAGDFNHDGWLDAVILNDNGLNYTLMNDGTGKLVWQDYFNFVTVPPSDNSGNYGCLYTDFDMDGDLDFYIAKCRQGVNDPTDPRRINVLFVNDGTGQYTQDAAAYGLASGRQSWTADFGDIDNDGDLDCFITQHDVISELYENINNDTFVNITAQAGLNIGGVPLQGTFVDLDNDGYMDLLVSGDRVDCYYNNGNKTFTKIEPFGNRIFGTFGLGDLNYDGFVDIYASTVIPFNNPDIQKTDYLFFNDRNDNHYLALNLEDTVGNRAAIGSMALLYGSWGIQVREVRAGEQYGVSNSHQLLFGLGDQTSWDSLVIRWPDGTRELFDFPNFFPDKHYQLTRGGCWSQLVNQFPRLEVLCGADSVQLYLDREVPFLQWSNGSTADTITVREPGLYYATFPDNGCLYQAMPVEVIRDPDTVAPTILYVGDDLLCGSDEAVLTLTPGLGYLWSTGDTTQSIRVSDTGPYSAIVEGYCIDLLSDTLWFTFVDPAVPVVATDTVQPGETAVLTAQGDSILWFADGSGIFQIGEGDTLYLPDVTEDRSVWARGVVTLDGQQGRVGPTAHAGTTKYNGAVTNAGLTFEVYRDMVLEEVTVFTDSAGTRIIEITNGEGFYLAYPFDIAAGESHLRLDAEIPPGSYSISTNTNQNLVEFGINSPVLWRSSAGVAYPYVFSDVMAITNSTLNATNFYYYFYDWQVREADRYCYGELAEAVVHVDMGTNTDPDYAGLTFAVCPIPASDEVILTSLPEGTDRIQLIEANGRVVLDQRIGQEATVRIGLSRYPSGVYLVRINGDQGTAVRRIVKL